MPIPPNFVGQWFPYYFDRFEQSDRVAAMTLAEYGAYHLAICLAWRYGSLPRDPKVLAFRIPKRCTPKIASVVLAMFEPMPDDPMRVFHPTVEEIRAEQYQKYLNRVKGGKASARTRSKQKTSSITQGEECNAQSIVEHSPARIEIQIKTKNDLKRLIETLAGDFPNLDERIIELGILYTVLQRNGSTDPITSTKYFHPQIKRVARDSKAMSDQAIDALLWRRSEQVWGERDERRPEEEGWLGTEPLD